VLFCHPTSELQRRLINSTTTTNSFTIATNNSDSINQSDSARRHGASFYHHTHHSDFSSIDSVRVSTTTLQERTRSPSMAPQRLPRCSRFRPIRYSPHAPFSRRGCTSSHLSTQIAF